MSGWMDRGVGEWMDGWEDRKVKKQEGKVKVYFSQGESVVLTHTQSKHVSKVCYSSTREAAGQPR